MPFYLEEDSDHSSIKCINCNTDLYINWEGEPYDGIFKKNCVVCGKELKIEVVIERSYYVSIKVPKLKACRICGKIDYHNHEIKENKK